MEPILHTRQEVVLGGARPLQLGMQDLADPVRVSGLGRAVHLDKELLGGMETEQEVLESLWVLYPPLHRGLVQLGEVLGDTGNELCGLLMHGGFSFRFSPVTFCHISHHGLT